MSQPPASAPDRPANYVVRHWRGELPLVLSFWVNGFVIWFGALFVIAFLHSRYLAPYEDDGLRLLRSTVIGLYYPVQVWQLVGISRSARRYQQSGGHILWPTLAQLVVVLACFRIFSGLVLGIYW